MKTPISPSHFLESGRITFPYGGLCVDGAPRRLQQQQQQQQRLCEVCNLQLSSPAQAQVHYNGRSHLRRLRQTQPAGPQATGPAPGPSPTPGPGLNSGLPPLPPLPPLPLAPSSRLLSGSAGQAGCASGGVPSLVRSPPSVVMQTSPLDLKPFLSFTVDTPTGLFPNYNTMDPVQKAVINHTFGVSLPPRKKQVISCNVCQLRFNSDSQAEAHYRGSKHAKKLKAQDGSKTKNSTLLAAGDSCPSKANGVSNTSQANGTSNISLANAASNTNQANSSSNTSHADAACNTSLASTASHTSSLTLTACDAANHLDSLPSLEVISTPRACLFSSSLCTASPSGCRPGCDPQPASPPSASTPPGLNPQPTSTLSATRGPQTWSPSPGAPTPIPQAQTPAQTPASLSAESEEEKAKKLLYCSLCKVAVNSLSQLEAHNTGSKHKTMLEAGTGTGPIKAYPRVGAKLKVQSSMATVKGSGLQNKTFHCQICDVHVNSEIQLKQHISSRRHKDRVAGKPMKPKYSPYNKQQRSSTTMTAKLALQKEMVTPISPGFLSSPFCTSSVSSLSLPPSPMSPSLSLAPRPSPPLFQASFLRAPGPIRASTGSILFAPY